MPVIVIGADTAAGQAIAASLLARRGEVRAFVTDAAVGARLKEQGAKVAVGDVSDASHVGGAALNAFSAVLVADAAEDGRERSFAADDREVFAAWAEALGEAGVRRVIWVGGDTPAPAGVAAAAPEFVAVTGRRSPTEIAAEVAVLDEAASL